MKKFNKDKYLKQLEFKRFYRKYERYFYIGIPCLLVGILGIYFAYSKFTTTADEEIVKTTVGDFLYGDVVINNYVNGQYTVEAPARGTGYKVDKIVCDNGAVGEWNAKEWGPTISNVTRRSKCNIYFVDAEKVNIGNVAVPLDDYGLCPTVNADGTVTVTEAERQYGYLCKAKDAYGDSYYYRGNVTNNYVKFGTWSNDTPSMFADRYGELYDSLDDCKNQEDSSDCTEIIRAGKDMYWRIIRINGDGTVRVIYDGTSAHANGDASTDRQIGTTAFNSSYNDNAYVGYMYGKTGASTYAETHANTNNSTIKTYLDTWYENNIKGTTNEQYIADNIFCNDRSFASNNSGTGAGTSRTLYRWYHFENYSNNNKMMLTCPQKNDAFTVNDTSNGNGALTYGVGLVTADEAVLAGCWSSYNSYYYLYSGEDYWTMSPHVFYDNSAGERYVYSNGGADGDGLADYYYRVNRTYGARPVFNLKSEVLLQGTGTASDPYHFAS